MPYGRRACTGNNYPKESRARLTEAPPPRAGLGSMPALFSRADRDGEHAPEWERARCIFLPTLTHFFGSDEAARCTRGYASEDPRPPRDIGVQRLSGQVVGALWGLRVDRRRC